MPVGVKGSYYFDDLFRVGEKCDFYAAVSIGVAFRTITLESVYYGDRVAHHYSSSLYGNLHIVGECYITSKMGLFLDLSAGLSTFGLAVHL